MNGRSYDTLWNGRAVRRSVGFNFAGPVLGLLAMSSLLLLSMDGATEEEGGLAGGRPRVKRGAGGGSSFADDVRTVANQVAEYDTPGLVGIVDGFGASVVLVAKMIVLDVVPLNKQCRFRPGKELNRGCVNSPGFVR